MLTRFTALGNDNEGFDDDPADDPWILVRLHHLRQVSLWNADGLRVQCSPPDVASIEILKDYSGSDPNEQVIQIHGLKGGFAQIEANGVPHTASSHRFYHQRATLTVRVMPRREVWLNFFRVTDTDGNTPRFVLAQAQDICDQLTDLYFRQANVQFHLHLKVETKIDDDFVTEQTDKENEAIFQDLEKKRVEWDSATDHISVFWVKKYSSATYMKDGEKRTLIGQAHHIPSQVCIVEDMADPQKQLTLVAHEIGHCLGAHHDKKRESALMFQGDNGQTKIYRDTVEEMHP